MLSFPELTPLARVYMTVFALAAAFSIAAAVAFPTKAPPKSSPYVFVDIDGKGHGSATHLGNGLMLTAGHVTKGAKELHVRTNDGLNYSAEILWQNNEYDVALIYVKEHDKIDSAPLSCKENYVGQQITITGNPNDALHAKSWGRVSGLMKTGLEDYSNGMWKKLITLDIAAAPGVSGAGVINNAGEVVGILVAGMVSDRGVFPYVFAVPAPAICHVMGRS